MRCGICVCGLNGSGKTTLACALAKELNFKHIEQYYLTSTDNPYSSSRTREAIEPLLLDNIKKNPCFVFSAI